MTARSHHAAFSLFVLLLGVSVPDGMANADDDEGNDGLPVRRTQPLRLPSLNAFACIATFFRAFYFCRFPVNCIDEVLALAIDGAFGRLVCGIEINSASEWQLYHCWRYVHRVHHLQMSQFDRKQLDVNFIP